MVTCVRCGRDVGDVHRVTPDALTNEILDSIDHGIEDLAGEDEIEICAECLDGLDGD